MSFSFFLFLFFWGWKTTVHDVTVAMVTLICDNCVRSTWAASWNAWSSTVEREVALLYTFCAHDIKWPCLLLATQWRNWEDISSVLCHEQRITLHMFTNFFCCCFFTALTLRMADHSSRQVAVVAVVHWPPTGPFLPRERLSFCNRICRSVANPFCIATWRPTCHQSLCRATLHSPPKGND